MAGYDIGAMTSSPEWQKMSPERRDAIMRKVQARNATGHGPGGQVIKPPAATPTPDGGPSIPVSHGGPPERVFTPSSVETEPVKADPNAPDFTPQGPQELLPGGPPDTSTPQGQRTAEAQEEALQQAAVEKAYPGYHAGWRPNIPGLGPTTIIPGAGLVSDVVGRGASALAQMNVAPAPGDLPGQAALRELTGPISGPAYKAGRRLTAQTPEEAGFDTAIALVTAGELGMAERTVVSTLKAAGLSDEMAEMFGGQWIDDAMRAKRVGVPIRMATTGLGRGLGSVAGGGPFWGPFGKGTFFGGLGELGSGAIGAGSSFIGKDWLVDKTVSDLGTALSGKDVVPELQGLPLNTKGGWEYTFKGDNSPAVQQVAGKLNHLEQYIDGRIQTLPFKTQKTFGFMVGPPGAKQFHSWSFDEALEEIEHLNDVGWSEATGAKRFGLSGKAARDASYELRNQLADQLNRFFPGLGDQWLAMRKRFGLVKDISREITKHSQDIFRDPNKVQEKLQMLFGQGPVAASVVDMLGPDAGRDILTVIRRGEPGPAYDQPGRSMSFGVSGHPGGVRPHVTIPHPYRGVGGVPLIMNPPAGPFSLAAGRKMGSLAPWLFKSYTPDWLQDQEQGP